ncbi:MAG: immune inhibitor A [Anaerolineae bacterium]|nr:immune inhibitor A [Anaerolineae bacterium]
MPSNRYLWIGILVLALVCCATIALVGVWQFVRVANPNLITAVGQESETITPTPPPRLELTPAITPTSLSPALPTQSPTATVQPLEEKTGGQASQASPLQLSTEQLLTQAILPERDQRLLAIRLKHKGQDIPQVIQETPPLRAVGAMDTFWVTDNQQIPPRQFQVTAILQYATDHTYWWVQEGMPINPEDLQRSAERFENNTYPTNRTFFGSEWSPGIDNDPHVHIFMGNVPGVAGYFSASNEYSHLAEPYSNEREMFFINLNSLQPGNDYFDGVLAHEFQHMIHWHQDRNEETWVNEGLSELATFLNGYGSSNFVGAYTAAPDTQLTSWAESPGAAAANYGAGFLFMAYFLQRYGEEMTQAVVANPQNGIAGFNAVLAERGYSERFDDIFADFVVANFLQDPTLETRKWDYQGFNPGPVALAERYSVYPQAKQTTVQQYGADYIELTGLGGVEVVFDGATEVKVVNNDAHSGRYQWYSHRGDDSNTHLTHAFDLRKVESATLHYWTWYDIEEDWDYGYVEISTDGGATWTILQTPHSATDNPTGNAYGPSYTGKSGEGESGWLKESVDLADYTGQEVLIRFEYVTDDAVNNSGWTIDDISIPEIGFYDDVESGPGNWQAAGFVQMDNVLPQRFLVQVLEIGNGINLIPLSLDDANRGTLTISGLGETLNRAIIIVSALAPVTSQPASYEYSLTALE